MPKEISLKNNLKPILSKLKRSVNAVFTNTVLEEIRHICYWVFFATYNEDFKRNIVLGRYANQICKFKM